MKNININNAYNCSTKNKAKGNEINIFVYQFRY